MDQKVTRSRPGISTEIDPNHFVDHQHDLALGSSRGFDRTKISLFCIRHFSTTTTTTTKDDLLQTNDLIKSLSEVDCFEPIYFEKPF